MKLIHLSLVLITLIIFTSCGKSPDIIYINGIIYSLDENNTVYEAMAVKDSKIMTTGTNKELIEKYTDCQVVDLKGKCVLPGFIDMEGSIIEFARNLNYVNLLTAKNLNDISTLISEKCDEKTKGAWVVCAGLNILNFDIEELNKLNKEYLDKIAPEHNVCIIFITQDIVLCNTKALNTLQITSTTPDPKDGEIGKDDNGMLTGYLYDSAINIVKSNIPDLTEDEYKNLLIRASKELSKYGITEIQDRTVNIEAINLFKKIIDSKELLVKIFPVLTYNDKAFEIYIQNGYEENYKDMMTVKSVSIDYDGALMLGAAQMTDNYIKKTDNNFAYSTPDEIESVFRKSIENKFQLRIKANGDKAVNNTLNILEKVLKEKNYNNHRTVIEYAEFVGQEDIKRCGTLKIIPSVRPETSIIDLEIYKQLLPEQNGNNLAKWNSLLKSTGYLTIGSNFPYNDLINPFHLIYILVNRQPIDTTLKDLPGLNEKITVIEAVKAYTKYAAFASFQEEFKGTLEKGKFADFVVLSEDIFKIDPQKIKDLKVLYTAVNGKAVFDILNK